MAVVKIATSTHRSEEFDAGDLVTKMSIVKRQKVKTDSTAYTVSWRILSNDKNY